MSPDLEPTVASYFDQAYRDYDAQNPPKKLDHYLDMIEATLGYQPGSLLDVGCGMGAFLGRASHRFPQTSLAAIDPEAEGVNRTRDRVPRADVALGRADSLPYDDGTFEVITAWDVLEHVPRVEEALREIRRCLQPEGLAAIVVPVYDGPTGPLVRLLDRDPTHVHKMPRAFWLDALSDEFEDIRWHGIHRLLLTRSYYVHRPTERLRNATAAIFLTARRGS